MIVCIVYLVRVYYDKNVIYYIYVDYYDDIYLLKYNIY